MSSSVIRFCSALQWDSGGTPSHSQFHLPPDPILITQASSVPIFLPTLTYHLPSPTLPMSFFTLMSLDYLTVSLKSLLRCTVLQQSTSSSPDKTTRSFFSAPSVSVMSLLLHSAHYRDAPLLNKCSGYMDSLMWENGHNKRKECQLDSAAPHHEWLCSQLDVDFEQFVGLWHEHCFWCIVLLCIYL